ncbi:hypothetical protein HDU98_007566 [Podochytrium sp. JEL0797]|nr:hypothetical protein HDU98_007566 [Podochytrium sp. JEL0797]
MAQPPEVMACFNALSQYRSSTFDMSTTNNGCLQARMDAMVPYFDACSSSKHPDAFFGFSSGSNYFVSPADMQWYCYTKYGLLLTGDGLPATPPSVEPPAPSPLPSTNSAGSSSTTSSGLSVGVIGGIVAGGVVLIVLIGFFCYRSQSTRKTQAVGDVAFANVARKETQPVYSSGQSVHQSVYSHAQSEESSVQFNNQNQQRSNTSNFPSEKHAGGMNRAGGERAHFSEKSGSSRGFENVNMGNGSSSGQSVQIVYIQPETDAGVALPVVAPPAYKHQ